MTKTRDLADLGGGFIQAGTGALQRTVESKLQDRVSVLDFIPESEHAAIKNGTSTYNATAAIQAALNVAGGARWSLYFPKGTYLISSPLEGKKNTTIVGDGWQSTIKAASGSNLTHLIRFGNSGELTSLQISDIEFDGNKDNNPTGGKGIIVIRGYKANMFNVRVTSCKSDGVYLDAPSTCFENYLYQVSLYNNGGYGLRMNGSITDTHIFESEVGYNEAGGVLLATSCSVNGCTVWGGGRPDSVGIYTAGVSFQIIGNRIEGHGKHGIYIGSNNSYGYISGNKIYANSFTAATSGLYDGIYVESGAGYGTITGNKIYSAISSIEPYSTRYAINFAGAHNQWTISGNDLSILTAGNPATPKISGAIVNGVLLSDKCDFNWINTNVQAKLSGNVTASSAFSYVLFPFNSEDIDTLSEFNNGIFIPKNSGLYRIEVKVVTTAAAANESLILSLCNSGGTEIRRIDSARSVSSNSQMFGNSIDEFLTAGTTYGIRYNVGSTSTTFLAGYQFTYIKIRAVPN